MHEADLPFANNCVLAGAKDGLRLQLKSRTRWEVKDTSLQTGPPILFGAYTRTSAYYIHNLENQRD